MSKNDGKINSVLVTEEYMIGVLDKFVQLNRTQALAAKALRIGESYLNLILHGNRPIPPDVAEQLGYRAVTGFEKIADAGAKGPA